MIRVRITFIGCSRGFKENFGIQGQDGTQGVHSMFRLQAYVDINWCLEDLCRRGRVYWGILTLAGITKACPGQDGNFVRFLGVKVAESEATKMVVSVSVECPTDKKFIAKDQESGLE